MDCSLRWFRESWCNLNSIFLVENTNVNRFCNILYIFPIENSDSVQKKCRYRKKSCIRYRHSKLRCIQGLPSCSHCIERGTRCTYDWLIGPSSRDVGSGYSAGGSVRYVPKPSIMNEGTQGFMQLVNTRSEIYKSISATETLPEATNDLFEQFDLDFVVEHVSAEQSFYLSKLPSLLDEWNDSQLFSQQFLAPNIEVRRGESTSSYLLDSSMESPGDIRTPNRPLQPRQNTSSQLSVILRRRGVIRYCLSSSIVIGKLTSYPKMMLQDKTLPPFICAPCHLREELRLYCLKCRKHQCLPKELAIFASLVDMFYSRTPNNADFVWSMIYAEQDRLHRKGEQDPIPWLPRVQPWLIDSYTTSAYKLQ